MGFTTKFTDGLAMKMFHVKHFFHQALWLPEIYGINKTGIKYTRDTDNRIKSEVDNNERIDRFSSSQSPKF